MARKKTNNRLHVSMVAATVDDINLRPSVLTVEVIRCVLEVEWLFNSCDKCSAQN